MRKVLFCDLDETLTSSREQVGTYQNAKPNQKIIDKVNRLYDLGWYIFIYTARGQMTFKGDLKKIEQQLRPLTEKWLKDHGIKFHQLEFGKPMADYYYYLDDKGRGLDEFLGDFETA